MTDEQVERSYRWERTVFGEITKATVNDLRTFLDWLDGDVEITADVSWRRPATEAEHERDLAARAERAERTKQHDLGLVRAVVAKYGITSLAEIEEGT